jgi:hypothetical protein
VVVTEPQQSATDGSQLAIGWDEVQDGESGIVGYAYGISSQPLEEAEQEPDILSWVPVERSADPYYIGKHFGGDEEDLIVPGAGEEEQDGGAAFGIAGFGYVQAGLQVMGEVLGTDYEVLREDLALSGPVYAVVRVTNGAGVSSVGGAPMIIYDATPPETAAVQAEPRQSDLQRLELTLTASDRESGIQAYRYQVFRIQAGPNVAWTSSPWRDAGAPSQGEMSAAIQITQFPPPGLQYNTLYQVRLWVRNRAGLIRAAPPVTIEMVPLQEEGDEGAQDDKEGVIDIRKDDDLPAVRRAP